MNEKPLAPSHALHRKMANFSMNNGYYNYDPNMFAPGAKCPNHGCRLYLTDQVGKGICEISGAYFDYDEGPFVAGDQSKNMAGEFEIKIINGQYQKVIRKRPQLKNSIDIKQK